MVDGMRTVRGGMEMPTSHGSSSKTFAGGMTRGSGITVMISSRKRASAEGLDSRWKNAADMVREVGPDPARNSSEPSWAIRVTDFSDGGRELC